jgi:hypothetical protein
MIKLAVSAAASWPAIRICFKKHFRDKEAALARQTRHQSARSPRFAHERLSFALYLSIYLSLSLSLSLCVSALFFRHFPSTPARVPRGSRGISSFSADFYNWLGHARPFVPPAMGFARGTNYSYILPHVTSRHVTFAPRCGGYESLESGEFFLEFFRSDAESERLG